MRSAIVLSLAAILSACTPTYNWREVRPEGSGVVLMMPCKPDSHARRVRLAGGDVRLTLHACSTGEVTWALAEADLVDPTRVGPALAELRRAAAANLGADRESPLPLVVDGATPNPASGRLALQRAAARRSAGRTSRWPSSPRHAGLPGHLRRCPPAGRGRRDLLRRAASAVMKTIFLVFAFAYFLSALLRAVTATLAPAFTAELGLQAGDLGLLAGAYFFGFAAMQLPLGRALDRFGPRRVLIALLALAVVGLRWPLRWPHALPGLLAARVLIGMGVSACLMAPLTSYRRLFSPGAQLRANSWMLMTGSFGMLASTLPVQWLLPLLGWRGLFVGGRGAAGRWRWR